MFKRIKQKRINHLYKKACKALAKFDNAIGKDTAYQFFKRIINTVYGKEYMNRFYGKVMTPIYEDTDSVKESAIYKDFNKKSEV